MSRYLLDTNNWIRLLKRRADAIRHRLDSLDAASVVVCSIVKAELLHGAKKYGDPEARIAAVAQILRPYASLPFDDSAAEHYADIRHDLEQRREIIGPNDLLIAAICRANSLTLVTTNTAEFRRVADLTVEDWMASA